MNDIRKMLEEICEEAIPQIRKHLKENFEKHYKSETSKYFYNKHDIQQLKDNPHLAGYRGISLNDPDLGLMTKKIDDFITEKFLGGDMEKYMQEYMEKNFQKHLNAAMDLAMEHKAKAMAFKMTSNKDQ